MKFEPRHAGAFVMILASTVAWAGPPFQTDDPEPVDYKHWEIYVFSEETRSEVTTDEGVHKRTEGVLPGFEFNYGILPDVQLSVTAPFEYSRATGEGSQLGYGDTEIAVKYRFIQEDESGWRPQVSFYPSLELPTADTAEEEDESHTRTFLPLWAQKSWGPWTTFGGGGYWINPGAENRDYWFFGWALVRKITENFSFGGEIFHQTADTVESTASSGFNLGGIYDFNEKHHLVFSAGRGIGHASGTNKFSYYVGYEVTF